MFKKILSFFFLSILLVLTSFNSLIIVNASETSTSSSNTSNSTSSIDNKITIDKGIKYYDGTIFDYPTLSNSDLEEATIYQANEYSTYNLPYENYRYGGQKPYFEFEECETIDFFEDNQFLYNLFKDNIVKIDNYDYNILKHSNDNGDYGFMMINRTISKNIYFDTNLDYITFYVDHNESIYDGLNYFNDLFDVSFNFPILKIDDKEYLGVRFNGKNKGFQLYTNNCIMNISKNYADNNYGMANYITKLTIPRVDYFKKISYTYFFDFQLDLLTGGNVSTDELYENKMCFAFDNEMSNMFYDYCFDIKSANLKEKYFVVNQTSYSSIYDDDFGQSERLISAWFRSITFDVIYARKYNNKSYSELTNIQNDLALQYPNYSITLTNTKLDSGDIQHLFQIKGEYKVSIDTSIGYVDGLEKYVYFEDFSVPDNFNNYTFKIKFLEFNPVIMGNQYTSEYLYTQDYTCVNYQKYTMSVDTKMNVYYQDIEIDYSVVDEGGWTNFGFDFMMPVYHKKIYYIYQSIRFNFYFDEERTMKIPNINKISIQLQFGYNDWNYEDNNGFYYDNLKEHPILVYELDLNNKLIIDDFSSRKEFGIFDIDYWHELNFVIDKEYVEDDRSIYNYDYKLENNYSTFKESDYSNFINGCSPLEIYYITAEYETIKMTSNSQGLHVIYDEFGNANVYDGDGNIRTEFGIYEDGGFAFPAIDTNKDGKYSSDEIVNSDTSELKGFEKYTEQDFWDEIKNTFNDFWNKITDGFKLIGQIITIVLGILVLVTITIYIIIPFFGWVSSIFKKLFKKKE